ncbi:DUF1569 domain-containing protein [Archangium violaceum]|uniref:DUF1569 domain-containing protein n=1 Tax=Archangium violaceum TaxID=83451 RepID=UPI0007C8272E|nr:DUF1569 domain-containing protein [Archangium violaceum]
MSRTLRMTTWEQVRTELDALERSEGASVPGPWTLPQVLVHCAQSIDCSLDGYPRLRPALFRATIGRIAKRKFLSQGFMSHGLDAAIPGAPALEDAGLAPALARLRQAITRFETADASALKPHLAYGPCDKREYEALHAMHLADHLGAVQRSPATRAA